MFSLAPTTSENGGKSRQFPLGSISLRPKSDRASQAPSVGRSVVGIAPMGGTERLTDVGVRGAKRQGYHNDGRGLYLQVRGVSKVWIHRYRFRGKSRWMGLGSYPDVTLSMARVAAQEGRRLLLAGIDPMVAREVAKQALANAEARATTFKECATACIDSMKAGWKNAKHSAQWTATLDTHVYPHFGSTAVSQVDRDLVLKALTPLWTDKPETASRVRQRIEAVLDWAAVKGYRAAENPARWKGNLSKLLPRKSKVRPVKHFASMPYAQVPAYYAELVAIDSYPARLLRLTILTAKRTRETRLCEPHEIKLGVWTIPPEKMKAGRELREPLTTQALAIIADQLAKRILGERYVFPGLKAKFPLSDMTMLKLLQTATKSKLTVHGFRSSFRMWAADHGYPQELAESALAHIVKDKTEAAYQRGDLLERRRTMMQDWADYVTARSIGEG